MNIEEREEMKKYLRWGDLTSIATAAKVERQTVILWLKGKIKKSTCEPYIVAFVKKRKKEVEENVKAELSKQELNNRRPIDASA